MCVCDCAADAQSKLAFKCVAARNYKTEAEAVRTHRFGGLVADLPSSRAANCEHTQTGRLDWFLIRYFSFVNDFCRKRS